MQRDFQLKLKSLNESGAFTGVASTYGDPPDLLGDVIEAGAFRQTVAQQGKGLPLLWSHMQSEPIGLARLSDAKDGLLCDGSLLLSDPQGRRAYDHLKLGSIKGLSIGYDVPAGKASWRDDGVRVIRECRVHEISLVAIPANPRAQVVNIKSLPDARNLLRSLRDGDVTADAVSDLLEIDRELKRLLVGRDPQEAKAAVIAELQDFARSLRVN